MLDPLLGFCMDLTRDGDDGVLLDPIFFEPFSRPYASPVNKTSRLRSLDGFKHENPEMYIIHSLPRPVYSYSMRMCISCFLVWIVALREYLLAGVFTGWL